MEEKCYNCKHENVSVHDQPCCDCFDHAYWIAKDKPKDATQCWLELVALYDYQLRCNEGADEEYYETKMGQFKNILAEFRNATANEDREEIW